MTITLTLSEVLNRCHDWEKFCEDTGYSVNAIKEGGGGVEVTLSEQQAIEYGIINSNP